MTPGERGMNPASTIIPADPGWRVLSVDDATGELFGGDPVIAWEVQRWPFASRSLDSLEPDHFLSVNAVTTTGRDCESYLMRPDGVVDERDVQSWPSMEAANAPEECRKRITVRSPE